jgi:hypothetical protein
MDLIEGIRKKKRCPTFACTQLWDIILRNRRSRYFNLSGNTRTRHSAAAHSGFHEWQ